MLYYSAFLFFSELAVDKEVKKLKAKRAHAASKWVFYNGKFSKLAEKAPRIVHRKQRAAEKLISDSELIEKNVTKVNGGRLTHTNADSIFHHKTMISFPGLSTHSKPKTAGLKMGPCHSLLGVNLLCPQTPFSPSLSRPFHRLCSADWSLSFTPSAAFRSRSLHRSIRISVFHRSS